MDLNLNLTKEEVIAEAKKLGLSVRSNFMDDWIENTVILVVGVVIGVVIGWVKFHG